MVSLSNNTQGNVNITTKNGKGVNLTSNNDTDVNANMNGNAQRAKSWAVGEGLIDGVDYSAKHYAQDAKESAEQASGGVEAITEAKEQALSAIDTEKTEAIADMETAKSEKISEIESTAVDFEDDLEALTTRAETAATNAETSETNAATSATSASTSATNASNSATSAATNANLALGYKNDAYTSADLAGQYKTAAEQAKTDSQYYRTQAYGYAAEASNAATGANQSATSAAQAKTAAENARDAAGNYAQQAEAAKDDIEAELDNYVPNTRKVNNKPLSTDITLTASDIGALANTTKYGYSVALSLDTTNYKLTLTLKDQGGTALSTKTVDFPIESVVVNGSYDSTNKKIVLTLQSGSTIDIPVGDLISGLQSEITSTNKLDSDLVDDTSSSHKFATAAQLNQIATNTSSISNLATVATSGSYNDLTNKPTIPTVNNAKLTIQKNGTTVKTFTANASSNVTCNITVPTAVTDLSDASNYVLSSSLATVATSGSYSDLSNKPTIPTDTNDLTNGAGFITSSALNPYALSSSLATVATSGSYNDLSNKPTIPDAQVQADWDVTDTTSKAYIKNKPYIPSGVVIDQTYDSTSANAQSGVAIAGAKFLQNTATGSNSLTILGTPTNVSNSVNVGGHSIASGDGAVALGESAKATAIEAMQIGYGTNNTAESLCVGFAYVQGAGNGLGVNYQLLDGATGLIPDARISTNIARTSDLSGYVQASNGNMTFANAGTEGDILYTNSTTGEFYGVVIGQSSTYGTGVTIGAGNSLAQNGYMLNLSLNGLGLIDASNMGTALLTVSNNSLAINGSEVVTGDNTRFDGQWVNSSVELANNVSMTSSTQDYSLSSYLPNDNYDYEVMFNCNITSGTSTGNRIYLAVTTDISSYTEMAYAMPRSNASVTAYGFCILPVGSGRKVTVAGNTTPKGTYQLWVRGYRRIGTNT